jgi:2-polyprenyl-6-methoxyphenol hydroxylase-like FAD-dependent oxidoreductase
MAEATQQAAAVRQGALYDVVILGAGLAGLTLARQLLLDTDRSVLLLERRDEVPPLRQKVGESSVQLAGYYLSKVLDLEEYLFREHYMKYNLRFYWKSAGRDNSRFEDYGKGFIRPFSNLASYQLDRNRLEADLLEMNSADPRFTYQPSIRGLEVELADSGPHRLRCRTPQGPVEVDATWFVDTTGRRRFAAKQQALERSNAIDHGSFFWWVDGLVDIDKLTDLSPREIRLKRERRATGHLPTWLATNHFMHEGLWFWVIPLQGKTSLGLVYDPRVVPHEEVFSVEKATAWVCREFPLFARDLPQREVLSFGGYRSFSHDCARTIDPARWALAGEAGRFSDPLYSPGSDLISIHNTLIVDAVKTTDDEELATKCKLYEQLMRTVYGAYVPGYATCYDALGDQETFCLKYCWELAIYFAAYVFPFINDLFTDRRFALGWLRQMSRLGPANETVQRVLSGYFQWKKQHRAPPVEPIFFDFRELAPLRRAQRTFYEVGVSVEEAKRILADQVVGIEELARFIVARVAAVVMEEERVLTHREFVEGLDLAAGRFDPAEMQSRWQACQSSTAKYEWSFDPTVMQRFDTPTGVTSPAAGDKER